MTKLALLSLTFLAALAVACGSDYPYYWYGQPITDYQVEPDAVTPGGIRVDTSGNEIDLDRLDDLTAEFDACVGMTVDRSGVVVKIAPDWYVSPCTGSQLFPCRLSEELKREVEKRTGKPESAACPYACAGTGQPPNVLVLPPNLAAYKHELIHLVLGIHSNSDPMISRCQ